MCTRPCECCACFPIFGICDLLLCLSPLLKLDVSLKCITAMQSVTWCCFYQPALGANNLLLRTPFVSKHVADPYANHHAVYSKVLHQHLLIRSWSLPASVPPLSHFSNFNSSSQDSAYLPVFSNLMTSCRTSLLFKHHETSLFHTKDPMFHSQLHL